MWVDILKPRMLLGIDIIQGRVDIQFPTEISCQSYTGLWPSLAKNYELFLHFYTCSYLVQHA